MNRAALQVALSDVGYAETPVNRTKYWAELDPGLQGQPWCAVAVSSWYRTAGTPLPAIDRPYGFVYVPDMMAWARRHDLITVTPEPGDVVCYGGGVHTGLFHEKVDGQHFRAVEGNTSSGLGGSQTNGGGVYQRVRPYSWVSCFVKPVTAAGKVNAPVAPPEAPQPTSPHIVTTGTLGGKHVALEFIGIPTDGDGDGAEAAPPGFLMCGNWLMHDKYDTAAHDKDTVVVKYGVREGAGGLRIGVEGGPPHGMAYCPVLVSD